MNVNQKENFETINKERAMSSNFIFFCVLFLVMVSGIFYLVILKVNEAVNYYSDVRPIIKNILGNDLAPNESILFYPALIGTSGFLIILVINAVLGFGINKLNLKTNQLHASMITLFALSIIFIFLIAISEFNYARLTVSLDIISNESLRSALSLNDNETILKISNYHNVHPYGWSNTRTTWWLEFGRFTLIIIGYLTYDSIFVNKLKYAKEVSKSIESSVKKSNIGKSKFNRFLNKIFAVNEKTVACWVLFVTILVLIPEVVYAVLLTLDNSEISKLLEWTLVGKNVISHEDGLIEFSTALNNSSNSNSLLLIHIPIILVGVALTTSIAFVFNIVREWRTDTNLFITQISISLAEIVATLIFGAVSKGSMNHIINYWNDFDMMTTINNADQVKLSQVEEFFKLPTFNESGKINHLWLYGFEYVSEFVISFFFVGASYAILIHKIRLVVKLQKGEREKIIINNSKINLEISK